MKKLFIYLLVAFVFIGTGCKKSNNNNPEPQHLYRLTDLSWQEEGSPIDSVKFIYNGEKVIRWSGMNADSLGTKAEVSYPSADKVEFLLSEFNNGSWVSIEKIIYTFSNNNLTTVEDYSFDNGAFVLYDKTTNQYNSNGDIIETAYSNFDNGIEHFYRKMKYTYEADKLSKVITDIYINDAWVDISKVSYQYEGNKVISSVDSTAIADVWTANRKHIFNYNGDLVTDVSLYDYNNSVIGNLLEKTEYTYDANNNMVKSIESYDGEPSNIVNYSYEEKTGNLSKFHFDDRYGYPEPLYSPIGKLSKIPNNQL